MTKEQKRTGRPPKPPKPGERISLGLKVTPEVKTRLDRAARETGRTQSQEAEARLQRSFEQEDLLSQVLDLAYGKQLAGLLMWLGYAMQSAGESASSVRTVDRGKAWLQDPYAFEQAVKAVADVLDAWRPPGEPKPERYEHIREEGDPKAADQFMRVDEEEARSVVIDQIWLLRSEPWEGLQGQSKFRDRVPELQRLMGKRLIDRLKLPPLTERMVPYDKDIALYKKKGQRRAR